MHRLPSPPAVRRLRLAAFLFCAKFMITAVAAGALAYSCTVTDLWPARLGGSLLVMSGLMMLTQLMVARRANCPLCMTPVLGFKECAKHRSARTFLGSHRLRVALAVLCLNRFCCPYCGESCEVKVRNRRAY